MIYSTCIGLDRDIMIENARYDAEFERLMMLFEMCELERERLYEEAELKVLEEGGSFDDLAYLYEEADEQVQKQQGGILKGLIDAILGIFRSIGEMISNFFNGGASKKIPENAQLQADKEELDTLHELINSTNTINTAVSFTEQGKFPEAAAECSKLDGIINKISQHKKFVAAVAIGGLAAAAGAVLLTKKDTETELSAIDKLRIRIEEATKAVESKYGTSEDSNIKKILNVFRTIGVFLSTIAKDIIGSLTSLVKDTASDFFGSKVPEPSPDDIVKNVDVDEIDENTKARVRKTYEFRINKNNQITKKLEDGRYVLVNAEDAPDLIKEIINKKGNTEEEIKNVGGVEYHINKQTGEITINQNGELVQATGNIPPNISKLAQKIKGRAAMANQQQEVNDNTKGGIQTVQGDNGVAYKIDTTNGRVTDANGRPVGEIHKRINDLDYYVDKITGNIRVIDQNGRYVRVSNAPDEIRNISNQVKNDTSIPQNVKKLSLQYATKNAGQYKQAPLYQNQNARFTSDSANLKNKQIQSTSLDRNAESVIDVDGYNVHINKSTGKITKVEKDGKEQKIGLFSKFIGRTPMKDVKKQANKIKADYLAQVNNAKQQAKANAKQAKDAYNQSRYKPNGVLAQGSNLFTASYDDCDIIADIMMEGYDIEFDDEYLYIKEDYSDDAISDVVYDLIDEGFEISGDEDEIIITEAPDEIEIFGIKYSRWMLENTNLV